MVDRVQSRLIGLVASYGAGLDPATAATWHAVQQGLSQFSDPSVGPAATTPAVARSNSDDATLERLWEHGELLLPDECRNAVAGYRDDPSRETAAGVLRRIRRPVLEQMKGLVRTSGSALQSWLPLLGDREFVKATALLSTADQSLLAASMDEPISAVTQLVANDRALRDVVKTSLKAKLAASRRIPANEMLAIRTRLDGDFNPQVARQIAEALAAAPKSSGHGADRTPLLAAVCDDAERFIEARGQHLETPIATILVEAVAESRRLIDERADSTVTGMWTETLSALVSALTSASSDEKISRAAAALSFRLSRMAAARGQSEELAEACQRAADAVTTIEAGAAASVTGLRHAREATLRAEEIHGNRMAPLRDKVRSRVKKLTRFLKESIPDLTIEETLDGRLAELEVQALGGLDLELAATRAEELDRLREQLNRDLTRRRQSVTGQGEEARDHALELARGCLPLCRGRQKKRLLGLIPAVEQAAAKDVERLVTEIDAFHAAVSARLRSRVSRQLIEARRQLRRGSAAERTKGQRRLQASYNRVIGALNDSDLTELEAEARSLARELRRNNPFSDPRVRPALIVAPAILIAGVLVAFFALQDRGSRTVTLRFDRKATAEHSIMLLAEDGPPVDETLKPQQDDLDVKLERRAYEVFVDGEYSGVRVSAGSDDPVKITIVERGR